ncbi:sensor histidine kinase [Caproiciproducens faecalis]|uniref:histidine kinase n=1 Tax=Caproiciproducens faecalis TaxID=2820301 RepID=A0ABS7DK80_9FIRM|nr:HAMP domain-containing sensor histidine kinase [Caproiciproducens faecalis]MBW7571704.1 HAMP domain-containing protein [Caproiciproducens faecalis]
MKLREHFRRIGIKWRIFAYFAGFTAVILVLLWVFQVVFLNSFYKAIKTREIRTSAQTIAKNIDSDDLSAVVQNLSQRNQIGIIVSDQNGVTYYKEDSLPNSVISRLSLFNLAQVYAATEAQGGTYFERLPRSFSTETYQHRLEPPKIESIIYAQIVEKKDGTNLMVLLNSTISPIDSTVNTLRVQLICITVVMLILSLLLALFLSRKISTPIIKINAAAKILGTGQYDVTFDETGYREISELGQTLNYAAKELSKTEALRRDLIANISHDLRTPLTMITGYSEVMRDLPGENTPENVQIIIDEATRLTTLVNDVLDISKLQSGTQPLSREDFNLTESIRTILQRYSKLTDYNISFHADEDVTVNADELKISQVVYNLVNNAITYTGKDKVVEITQSVRDGRVKISVRDTGEGIPQDKLNDIWDRYYKVDKEHKRAQIGTGLGLSIVKSILDMHGGAYGVQSQEGSGSVFWFELDIL